MLKAVISEARYFRRGVYVQPCTILLSSRLLTFRGPNRGHVSYRRAALNYDSNK